MILLIQRVPILGAPLLVVGSIIGPAEVHVGAAHDADGDVAAAEAVNRLGVLTPIGTPQAFDSVDQGRVKQRCRSTGRAAFQVHDTGIRRPIER